MKKLIKNSLVMLVMLTTLLGNANEVSSLRNLNDSKTTMLTLLNVKEGNQLIIKDAFGIVLYKENISESGNYNKGFDLTSLPDGDYFFELDKELEIKTIPFTVTATVVDFEKKMESVIYKPFVISKEDLVHITKLSLNKQPLKINIYYTENSNSSFELIHSETIKNTQTIKRVYNLDENIKGKYKIVCETEGRTFIDYVRF